MDDNTQYYCLQCMQPSTADEFIAYGMFHCPVCGNERLEVQLCECEPEAA